MGIKKKSAELCDSVDEIQQERQRCGPAAVLTNLRGATRSAVRLLRRQARLVPGDELRLRLNSSAYANLANADVWGLSSSVM